MRGREILCIFAKEFRRGRKSPPSFCIEYQMIDRETLGSFITGWLEERGCFLTDLKVTPDNHITVEIDSLDPVDIDLCVVLTRALEGEFDRDKEDYELEVGSAGLTSPLKVPMQYQKYLGQDMEVLTADGRKLYGVLLAADADGFTLRTERKVKPEGAKRPVVEQVDERFGYSDVKYCRYDLKF